MPAVAFAIVTSDWLVLVALGARWAQVGPIFALLAVSALVQPMANTVGWLFLSQDRTRDLFRWGMIGGNIVVVAIVVGLPWGAVGVAASYSITLLFLFTPLLLWFVGRRGPVRVQDFFRSGLAGFLAAMAVFLALIALRQLMGAVPPTTGLAAAGVVGILVTGIALCSLPGGRKALRDFHESARRSVGW
jgi:PST family polysaccharide transporter